MPQPSGIDEILNVGDVSMGVWCAEIQSRGTVETHCACKIYFLRSLGGRPCVNKILSHLSDLVGEPNKTLPAFNCTRGCIRCAGEEDVFIQEVEHAPNVGVYSVCLGRFF